MRVPVFKKPRRGRNIFVSYEHGHGSAVAQRLSKLLIDRGHDVWMDVARIRGGSSWSEEIEEALNACDLLLAVLTPGSNRSPMCRGEQIWAAEQGKLVIPILAAPGASVPIHLKDRQYRKYPEQEAELLLDINADRLPSSFMRRTLYHDTVPSLPKTFLKRNHTLAALRDLVFMEGAEATVAVTAVAGMGGIGKTVLTTALCHDLAVQRAFPDGIAWVSFGRDWNGDFMARMREIGRALGETVESGWDSQEACENRYRTILRKRAALVVIDDVWNIEQLRPMLVDSSRSRLIFTTRDSTIADAVGNRSFTADLLTTAEARDLLARTAGLSAIRLPSTAAGIIKECGGLALAVAQIGSSLKGKAITEWSDTLEALKQADIRDIEERLPTGQRSFFQSLAVSVDALPTAMKDRYMRLGVLLEDTPAPLTLLRVLWRLDERPTRHTCRYLVERSLASRILPQDPDRGIKLHDLQLDYVRARHQDQAGLALILDAARSSASVVEQDPTQFSSQMVGRLLRHQETLSVRSFSAELSAGALRPWLRPLWPSLFSRNDVPLSQAEGHLAAVMDVVLTAKGKHLLSASLDDTVKLWQRNTGKEMLTLRGHRLGVYTVAVSDDGRRAVSGSLDKTLRVWDLKTGSEVGIIQGAHARAIASVVLSRDGRQAITASWDKTLKLWDLETGKSLRTFKGHSKSVNCVAVDSKWKTAVSASEDGTLKVWNTGTGDARKTLRGHAADVWAVAVTPNGKFALSASEDTTLKLWDLAAGRAIRTFRGHASAVYGVALSRDGRLGASASDDMTVKLWDVNDGTVLHTLGGHSLTATSVTFSTDTKVVVSGSYDASVKVWKVATGKEIGTLKGRSDGLNAVVVTPDQRQAVFASDDCSIRFWDINSGQCSRNLSAHTSGVNDVALSGDGRYAASVSGDETLRIWDVVGGREVRVLRRHSWLNGVGVSADCHVAVTASDDNTVNVWDLQKGSEQSILRGHRSSVIAVALSRDGDMAVSASYDSTLRVWNIPSAQSVHVLKGHREPVSCVALSHDGSLVLSGSDDGILNAWNPKTGRQIYSVQLHADSLSYLAISPDHRHFASASWDKTVKICRLAGGSLVTTFTCDGPVLCCQFVNEHRIIAGDNLGRVHLLAFEP